MEVLFADESLDRLEVDAKYDAGFDRDTVRAYRKRLQVIRAAPNEAIFSSLQSLRYERLSGHRSHQWSMALDGSGRLILEQRNESHGTVVVVKGIEHAIPPVQRVAHATAKITR